MFMQANDIASTGSATAAERLERGEVLFYATAPFALPQGGDLDFLLQQELGSLAHKNISYNPSNGKVNGFVRRGGEQIDQLRGIFARFSQAATEWLTTLLPQYPDGWQLDRAAFGRKKRRHAVCVPRRATISCTSMPFPAGRRTAIEFCRVFANINPREPRIWVTSDPFAKLLKRYGEAAGLPGRNGTRWLQNLSRNVVGLFQPNVRRRSEYDLFMLRFHDYLKLNEEFQEKGPKYLHTFPPGCVWVAMTDACSHAVLRGRYALEHSYFVSPAVLALPEESPPVLLQKANTVSGRRAA